MAVRMSVSCASEMNPNGSTRSCGTRGSTRLSHRRGHVRVSDSLFIIRISSMALRAVTVRQRTGRATSRR